MLHPMVEAKLIWYFAEGLRVFSRSTLGPMLERAERMSVDSAGKKNPRWAPNSWNLMPVHEACQEPSYTPNEEALLLAAEISRRLHRMRSQDAQVLEIHYGDLGARWARASEGRIVALYMATDAGRKHCEQDVKRHPQATPAQERIACLVKLQRTNPMALRRQKLQRMRAEAEALLGQACKAWEGTHAR